ncbi:MAG TPA: O-acetyl-ADP-ribose deacetylase [Tenuifilaceae bacterium]|nr:O-acetyl-ADP-ribose deacetylase [Tenuifilaceae bacterium]HPE19566.1 O-acetyl-ADP-ribose deacetylase [Tenuifilaceae bacterium]HPJ46738.1 O-acetyl-ADP-ribose deacetylase [Tenuifilaceae bacterium]HPQ33261.1 O-acetyl-ADP-ribose deacetylase [Tenuifilaceae bacterium]HRX69412.1 O-acetyl-ADP-ribose deacetylase [Tenuifilaceae bacterium]
MGKGKINIIQGDITKLEVDAIVNAANSSLLGGGGVDGAIHRAAGSELLEECKTLGGCPTGEARITKGYNLPAKFVIHTVGPVWRGGSNNEVNLLKNAYLNSLLLAQKNGVKTIAFPNISTGIYGFPKHRAAKIAIRTVKEHLAKANPPKEVTFVCFDEENLAIYNEFIDTI